jgi:hypothetical protein
MSDCFVRLCLGNAIYMKWDWLHPDQFLTISPKAAGRPSRFTNRDSAGVMKCPLLDPRDLVHTPRRTCFLSSNWLVRDVDSQDPQDLDFSSTGSCYQLPLLIAFTPISFSSICLQTRIRSVKFYEGDEKNFLSNRPL